MTPGGTRVGPKRRILIADDDAAVLRALVGLFEAVGYVALAASSALQAMSLLRTEAVDVVLADATLEPTSGAVLLDSVRARFPHVATALMSGYRPEHLKGMQIEQNGHEFVSKPFRLQEAMDTIERALATVRATPGTA